jgi:hypothetical protein
MRKLINKYLPALMLLAALACIGSVALAQNPPPPPDPNQQPDPNNPDPQQQNMRPGGVRIVGGGGAMVVTMGPGAGGPSRMRFGGPMPGMMGGALEGFINRLGMVNLTTDFTLTADQKTKIQAIRDDFKKQTDEWRTAHADEIKQLDEQQQEVMNGLQTGNIPDPGQMQEMEEQRRALYETAPNGEDHVAQIKALFTPEQDKIFEARKAEIEKAREAEMEKMGVRVPRIIMNGGGGGMWQPAPPTPPAPPAEPKEPEKKK